MEEIIENTRLRQVLSALHVVKDGSGPGMVGMLENQMQGAGVPRLIDAPRSRVIPFHALDDAGPAPYPIADRPAEPAAPGPAEPDRWSMPSRP